jgi:hypothetical protein
MDNMDISGEVLCHIPNSNAFAGFPSGCKPCHIYDNDVIPLPSPQVLAESQAPDSKLLSSYFYGIQDKTV